VASISFEKLLIFIENKLDNCLKIWHNSNVERRYLESKNEEIKVMATLPEGYTVRKVGNSLKVVPMRRRVVKEEKAMFPAIQHSSGFGWQLMYVRRPSEEESKRYAKWILFGVSNSPVYELSSRLVELHQRHPEILDRPCDGSTPSNENSTWIITQEQFDMFLAEDKVLVGEKERQEAAKSVKVPVATEEVKQMASRYGTSENAWEKEDERAWALMRQYGL
jgi:hypothetical protein